MITAWITGSMEVTMKENGALQDLRPADIEKRSFEIISEEMGDVELDPL